MNPQEPKNEWVSPELLVLTRHHPEEVLLTTCKGYKHSGAIGDDSYCSATDCTGDCYIYADS
jgi:hypothetical protein